MTAPRRPGHLQTDPDRRHHQRIRTHSTISFTKQTPQSTRTSLPRSMHMTDHSRWRIPADIASLINTELATARTSDQPWPSLERAHLLSQHWAWPHTRVHFAMLRLAVRLRTDAKSSGRSFDSPSPAPDHSLASIRRATPVAPRCTSPRPHHYRPTSTMRSASLQVVSTRDCDPGGELPRRSPMSRCPMTRVGGAR